MEPDNHKTDEHPSLKEKIETMEKSNIADKAKNDEQRHSSSEISKHVADKSKLDDQRSSVSEMAKNVADKLKFGKKPINIRNKPKMDKNDKNEPLEHITTKSDSTYTITGEKNDNILIKNEENDKTSSGDLHNGNLIFYLIPLFI